MYNINRIATQALLFAMLIAGVITLILKGPVLLAFNFLGGFAFYFLVSFVFDKGNINPKYKLLVNLSIWLHLVGLAYLYDNFVYYDKILHIAIPIFITLFAYDFYSKALTSKKSRLLLFVFLSVIIISIFWEIYESLEDIIFGFRTQGVYNSSGHVLVYPISDTIQDLFLGFISTLLTLFVKKNRMKH
jgi:hypothetical protein